MKPSRIIRIAGCICLLGLALSPSARADVEVPPGCLELPGGDICPLEHTDVTADIAGYIARVTVTQTFSNPSPTPIEAVYTFPLPEDAAVDSMEMRIGKRFIKGDIRKRQEARAMYEAAKAAGQVSGLLDQERPNIFTQSVANIMPGESIQIMISYVQVLPQDDGAYRFQFPMVVGPRYNPAGVSDAARISPPVAAKGSRAGHDISLRVNLDAGMPVSDIDSELHAINVKKKGDGRVRISLAAKREIPNRDFILRYQVRGDEVADAVLTHADARGGFFTLVLQPPRRVTAETVTPKELIFVIDSSGSMGGFPIEKAKATMRKCIQEMNEGDTFNLVSFAGGVGYCFDGPVQNTKKNRKHALAYLDNLHGGGGTEMMKAIHAALAEQNDPERLRIVCFMTDGYIGNEMQILDTIQKNAGTARVFSFGIGSSVNTFLIENMAREGRGRAEVVTLASDGDAAAERFGEAVRNPVLTDIEVDYGTLDVYETYPALGNVPDLFSESPVVIHGRYRKGGDGTITIRGNTAQGPFERRVHVALPSDAPDHDAIASVWAREKIAAVMAEDWMGMQRGTPKHDTEAAITQLGLDFGLVTPYTSFVAIENRVVNKGGRNRTVEVPVEMPDGVSHEGIFGADRGRVAGNVSAQSARKRPAVAAVPMIMKSEPSAEAPAPPSLGRGDSRQVAADAPAMEAIQSSSIEEKEVDELADKDDNAISSKLAPALQALIEGRPAKGVTVENGWVEVYIEVSDMTVVDAIRRSGAKIVATTVSAKLVHARVRVSDLAKMSRMSEVTRIKPAGF